MFSHTAVCLVFSFSFLGDRGAFLVNWLKLAALHLTLGPSPPLFKPGVGPGGRVLYRPGMKEPWPGLGTFPLEWRLSLEKRLWMSWNFSFSSCKKTSTRSFFSRLSCSTMVFGTSGITQATTRLRNITRFWRKERSVRKQRWIDKDIWMKKTPF